MAWHEGGLRSRVINLPLETPCERQRIATAFPTGEGSYFSSKNELIDSYSHTKKDTWFIACWGKMVCSTLVMAIAQRLPFLHDIFLRRLTALGD